jgi:hypothetical protein
MTQKSMDIKLKRILDDPSCKDFIIADAKDGDMAYGVGGLGNNPNGKPRTLDDYRNEIRQNVAQGLIDIMLISASTSEQLTIESRLFENSHVTPACRANDTTDIHLATGSVYSSRASRPFRSAKIDHIMYGRQLPERLRDTEPIIGADLGLYSITFNNDLERDLEALERYSEFRAEAERKHYRHFLEVFDPNACGDQCPADLPSYLNDMIVRTLAGVVKAARPLFLKIPYHGPAAMEKLAGWDRTLIPGILGGASGTTFDAFHQLWEARKYGARVALYGRMINNSEHQATMIQHLRWIGDGQSDDPAQAVRSYHSELAKLSIKPFRSLEDDLRPTRRGTQYGGASTSVAVDGAKPTLAASVIANPQSATLDVASMTAQQKIDHNLKRWDRVLG